MTAPILIEIKALDNLTPAINGINAKFANAATASSAFSKKSNDAGNKVKKTFQSLGSTLGSLAKKFAILGTVAVGVTGFIIRNSLIATDAMAKQASKIGTTTEALSKLRYAAELTGVAQNTMDMAMQRFVRRTAEAAKGTGEAKNALLALGLNAQELVNMPLDDQMQLLADAFGKTTNESEKLALAFKLFDSEGAALVNMLAEGEEGLEAMFEEAEALGLVMRGSMANGVVRANDAFTRLKSLLQGITRQFTAAIAPALEEFATLVKTKILSSIQEADGSVERFANNMALSLLEGARTALIGVAKMINDIGKIMNTAMVKFDNFRIGRLSNEVDDLNEKFDYLNSISAKIAMPELGAFTADETIFMALNGLRTNMESFPEDVSAMFRDVTTRLVAGQDELDQMFANRTLQGADLIDIDSIDNTMTALIDRLKIAQYELSDEFVGPLQETFTLFTDTVTTEIDQMALTVASVTNNTLMGIMGQVQSIIGGLMKATEHGSKEHKKLYLLSKGVAVAQAIIAANMAAASIRAAYATASMTMGPAAPAFIAKGEIMANIALGLGMVNAAVIAATAVKSYAGGGFTGTGARSGGVDGKGGFPAILHPNETVVDHTKNQSFGGETVVINQTINVTTGVQDTVRAEIANLMPQIAEVTTNAVAQTRMRGGNYSKQLLGR